VKVTAARAGSPRAPPALGRARRLPVRALRIAVGEADPLIEAAVVREPRQDERQPRRDPAERE
jgi:hypothetical protein